MDAAFKSLLLNKVTASVSLLLAAVIGAGVVTTQAPAPPSSQPASHTSARRMAPVPSDEERLQGTWDVVALETEGRPVSVPAEFCDQAVTFRNDTLRTRFAPHDDGAPAAATFKLGASRAPRTIDVLVEGARRSSGIYLLEKGTLTICLAPVGHDRPTEFKTTPEGSAVLFVLKPAAARG
jgi:uncharacterized protein (TIGR03067 family)